MANKLIELDTTTKKGFKKVNLQLGDTLNGYFKESSNGNPMIALYGSITIGDKEYQVGGYFTEKQ